MNARFALPLLAVAAVLSRCGPSGYEEPDGNDVIIEVDCIGMALEAPNAGARIVTTRFSQRCVGLMSDTTWGGDLELWTDGANYGVQNGMALTINYAGKTYLATSGEIFMEWHQSDPNYAIGWYEVGALDDQDRPVTLKGKMEWCDFSQSTECPYLAETFGLEYEVSFSAPDNYNTGPDTYASECRVLLDADREAVQVDVALGVFEGTNVSMNWLQCGMINESLTSVPQDSFQFRAAGVPGPGTYSYETQAVPDPADPFAASIGLPGFRLYIPNLYFGWTCFLPLDALMVTDHASGSGFVDPYNPTPTACTFTIEENPGRFELDCENARKYSLPGQGVPTVGPFHFESDCDVRYVSN